MAMAVCKPLGILPTTHCGVLSTRQRIESHDYQSHESSIKAPCKAFHQKRVNIRAVYARALRPEDGGKEKCNNKEGGVEDANTAEEPSCAEIPESTMFLGSPDRPEPVKEEQSSAGKEKPELCRGRLHLHGLANKLGVQKNATTARDEDLKKQLQRQLEIGKKTDNSKQPDARCRLRSLWHTVRRPQNLLAAFLTGLLLYAIALFGWQVMVVAVDVTLFVLKCSFVALVLLLMYIFLI